jgi:tetratricopeptide (TPR) repeat protein
MQGLPAPNDGAKLALFYAQSWALVHHLAVEKTGGTLRLEAIPGSADVPTNEELRQYVGGPLGKTLKMTTPPSNSGGCGDGTAARLLSEVEAFTFRAQALADGERPEAALPLLLEALRLDPDNRGTLETLGFVHFAGNRPADAAEIFDRVIASGAASHLSYFYRAVLAGPIPQRSGGSAPIPAVEYLNHALRLNPEFAPARERLKEAQGAAISFLASCRGLWHIGPHQPKKVGTALVRLET